MEYRILGPLDGVDEGEPVALGRLKERLVLAVLLLHANEFVSRERLIDELWGESPPPTAKKAVNVYVSQLRKALTRNGHDPIATADGGYRLEVGSDELDAAHLRQLLANARERTAAGELEAEALDAYQLALEVLVEELGVEPSQALQRLQKGILIQDPALELLAGIAAPNGFARRAPDAPLPSTRLVLAEDHYLLREGMRRLLETDPDLEVAAVCEDLDSLLAAVEAERPDVVVTDIRMPPGNLDEGIRASDRLRVEHPDVGVVVL